jgi:hypothetical protein
MIRSALAGGALSLFIAPGIAPAFPSFLGELPNAPDGCGTCHLRPTGGGPRNPFGIDADVTRVRGAIDWATLSQLDSDEDGRSNGFELGDPDGVWQRGDEAPAGEITSPGVPDAFDEPGTEPPPVDEETDEPPVDEEMDEPFEEPDPNFDRDVDPGVDPGPAPVDEQPTAGLGDRPSSGGAPELGGEDPMDELGGCHSVGPTPWLWSLPWLAAALRRRRRG